MSWLHFAFQAVGNVPAVRFGTPWWDATASAPLVIEEFIFCPLDGVLRNLRVKVETPAAGSDTATFTVRVNGVNTALTVTHTESATTSTDSSNTVAVAAGDTISLGVTTSASVSGSSYRIAFEVESSSIVDATGTAAGTSTATGEGASIAEAVGTAAGTSTASATGGVVPVIDLTPPEEETVGDIYLVWEAGTIDLSMRKDDVAEDLGLRTACLLSLFTDRRAEDDDPLPALDNDRRGWWADEFALVPGDKIGSRLWLLDRSKRTGDIPRRAEELVREALQWMLEDRVAERIDVVVETREVALLIQVTLFRPQRDPVTFRFAHVWDGELRPDQVDELVPGYEFFRWDAGQGWDEGVWA